MVRLSTLREFAALKAPEQLAALYAVVMLIAFYAALRLRPFEASKRFAEQAGLRTKPGNVSINRILEIVQLCSRHLRATDNCLLRSLTSLYLLRRNGYEATLRIGAKRSPEGGIDAHAWLETLDGALLIDEASLVGDYVQLT